MSISMVTFNWRECDLQIHKFRTVHGGTDLGSRVWDAEAGELYVLGRLVKSRPTCVRWGRLNKPNQEKRRIYKISVSI